MNKTIALLLAVIFVLACTTVFFSLTNPRFFPGEGQRPFGDFGGFSGFQDNNAFLDNVKEQLGLPGDATEAGIKAALGLPEDATQQQMADALREKGIIFRRNQNE